MILIESMKTLQPGGTIRAVQDSKLLTSDNNHMNPGLSIPLVQRLRTELRKAPKRLYHTRLCNKRVARLTSFFVLNLLRVSSQQNRRPTLKPSFS